MHKLIILIMLMTLMISMNNCKPEYNYESKWFTTSVDHFSFHRNDTFKIKYLVNDTYWNNTSGPIFFYTGNEAKIEVFATHIGFMWEIAEEFNAKLVFAEHRYYGASMPFGDKSLDLEHIGFLTPQQAIADFAELINFLQGNTLKPKYPVIVIGASYGGMLSAYLRMKYPHIVSGAVAASAPLRMFPGMIPCSTFASIVTSSYSATNAKCADNIRRSWSTLRDFIKYRNNTNWLKTNWNLCDAIKNQTNIDVLIDFLKTRFEIVAMVNYPFASDYLVPLPANPVRFLCQYLDTVLNGQTLLESIGKVLKFFTNGNSKCVDYMASERKHHGNSDAAAWDYQACTVMVAPMCTNNVDDMFEESPWNFTECAQDCYKKYNVYPKPDIAKVEFGGNRLQAASNIVFSNGMLDPWSGAGILKSVSDTVKSVIIIDGAHHLDLMPSNPADPPSVLAARVTHKQNIRQWINEFWKQIE